jgi:hypothetical protein
MAMWIAKQVAFLQQAEKTAQRSAIGMISSSLGMVVVGVWQRVVVSQCSVVLQQCRSGSIVCVVVL